VDVLAGDLNDGFRLNRLIARATLSVQEAKQFLQAFGVRRIPQERTLPRDGYEVFVLQLLEVVREG